MARAVDSRHVGNAALLHNVAQLLGGLLDHTLVEFEPRDGAHVALQLGQVVAASAAGVEQRVVRNLWVRVRVGVRARVRVRMRMRMKAGEG